MPREENQCAEVARFFAVVKRIQCLPARVGGIVASNTAAIQLAPQAQTSSTTNWLPVVCWTAVLFVLSTSGFSAANTSRFIEPIIRWFLPMASPTTIAMMHMLIRKAAHFTNYGILFWLLIRGPMRRRPYMALTMCLCYALLDEGHQVFAQERTASLYDVALDSSGALFSRFLHAAVSDFA